MSNRSFRFSLGTRSWGAWKIAGGYLLAGAIWILFSDKIAEKIAPNPSILTTISIYKGWGFIIVTAFLLYWLIQRHTAALSESEGKLQLITDSFPALISYVDSDRRYQFSNQAYEEWFGYKPDGKKIDDVLGSAAYQTILEYVDAALEGNTVNYQTEIPYQDGGSRFVDATYVPDRGQDGHIKGFYSLVQDITGRKQEEEEQRQWADAFEHCAHGIAISNPDTNRILVCNSAFALLHKSRIEDIVGSAILGLYDTSDHDCVRQNFTRADQIGHAQFEANMIRRNGSTFPAQTDLVSVLGDDGELLYRVVTAQDISQRKNAEKEIADQASILAHVNDAVLTTDENFIVTSWNSAAERIFGWKAEEVMGRKGEVVLQTEFFNKTRSEAIQELQEGGEFFAEVTQVRKDGTRIHIGASTVTRYDENGNIVGYVSVNRDITERKRAEAALQRAYDELELKVQERTASLSQTNTLLQALMDYMPDHIYFKDTQGRFIRNSKSQAEMLGLSHPDQVVGKTDFDFFPHAAKAYAEEQEVMRTGQPSVDFEEQVIWPDKRETWVSTTKVPLRNSEGQIIGIFGISRDITQRKQGEQAIRQLNINLTKQAAQLHSANKELEAFSYSISHDLRAPLRAINGYTRILVEDYSSALDEEGRRVCKVITTETLRMGKLIDDLLSFSRLSRKEIQPAKIDMKALAYSVFGELTTEEQRQRIDLKIGRLPQAKGDPALMHQVWLNLISNAIKFSSKKERAVIELGTKRSDDEIIYCVQDNGAGFDILYVDKLFGVFQRLHSEDEFEGTGVGLAIMKRIIQRHGGRVWAEGEVDKGATFYFALPRESENHE
jgi:PAS domain S-box-containing protein